MAEQCLEKVRQYFIANSPATIKSSELYQFGSSSSVNRCLSQLISLGEIVRVGQGRYELAAPEAAPPMLEDFRYGTTLAQYVNDVDKHPERRDIFEDVRQYLDCEQTQLVCALYGLRRTGKSTIIDQILCDMPEDELAKSALVSVDMDKHWDMLDLKAALKYLAGKGIQNVFIDEATYLQDFCSSSSFLSNIFAKVGMRIVLAGKDSLAFHFAEREPLYDRLYSIHTTRIGFMEHARITGIKTIDDFIERGGIFRNRKVSGEEVGPPVGFENGKELAKYLDTAIIDNISHALDMEHLHKVSPGLIALKDAGEFRNAVCRVVLSKLHEMTTRTFTRVFKSHDWGTTSESLAKRESDSPRLATAADIMQLVSKDGSLLNAFMEKFGIIVSQEQCSVKIDNLCIAQLESYLRTLDVFDVFPVMNIVGYSDGGDLSKDIIYKRNYRHLLVQPGMRYCHTKELLNLFDDMTEINGHFITAEIKKVIRENVLAQVRGELLEEIVLKEAMTSLENSSSQGRYDIFQIDILGDRKLGVPDGEIDMVIHDKENHACALYEIKHSSKIVPDQSKYLRNDKICEIVESLYGVITERHVLYRGEDAPECEGVQYENIERWVEKIYREFPGVAAMADGRIPRSSSL